MTWISGTRQMALWFGGGLLTMVTVAFAALLAWP
jgi:hypothetical protein